MREDEKIVFDDEFIRKRLKSKIRTSALIYVIAAIFAVTAPALILGIIVYGISLISVFQAVLLIACTVMITILIVKHVKMTRRSRISKGTFTVAEDTITGFDVKEKYTRYGVVYEYTLNFTRHNEYTTNNSELVGHYTEAGEKCYVVAYTDFPDDPVLVFSKRIYRYTGYCMK